MARNSDPDFEEGENIIPWADVADESIEGTDQTTLVNKVVRFTPSAIEEFVSGVQVMTEAVCAVMEANVPKNLIAAHLVVAPSLNAVLVSVIQMSAGSNIHANKKDALGKLCEQAVAETGRIYPSEFLDVIDFIEKVENQDQLDLIVGLLNFVMFPFQICVPPMACDLSASCLVFAGLRLLHFLKGFRRIATAVLLVRVS